MIGTTHTVIVDSLFGSDKRTINHIGKESIQLWEKVAPPSFTTPNDSERICRQDQTLERNGATPTLAWTKPPQTSCSSRVKIQACNEAAETMQKSRLAGLSSLLRFDLSGLYPLLARNSNETNFLAFLERLEAVGLL
jgi:hypothetical protein